MRRLRVAAPLVASAAVLTTLVACLVITLVQRRYIGGLKLPYFSDTGRDWPSYIVFGIGLTVVALAIATTWVLNLLYQAQSLRLRIRRGLVSHYVLIWSALVAVAGVLSTLGLPLLAFCSTSMCPDVHSYATYWFFLLETLAIVVNTCIMYKLLRVVRHAAANRDSTTTYDNATDADNTALERRTQQRLSTTVTLQALAAALLLLSALFFTALGVSIATPSLSVRECLAKQLGRRYCTDTMRAAGTNSTRLWRYGSNFGLHQARAVCEWVAMLALVGYSLSFLLYRDHTLDAQQQQQQTRRHASDAPLLSV